MLEVARALRFQSGLSLSFWGDCVLTATHIINRLPNAALKFEVSYEKLMGKAVDYIELKVFGCLAIAHNSTHGSDKFAPRGILCAFIGYPSNTKGYRLLNLTTMQPLLSRHVVFHEHIFPLNKNGGKSYMRPLPIMMPLTGHSTIDDEFELGSSDEVIIQESIDFIEDIGVAKVMT